MVHRWETCDLLDLVYLPREGFARLALATTEEILDIKCIDVLMFKVCNSPGDMQPTFVVDAICSEWGRNDAENRLKESGYAWRDIKIPERVFHLKVDGGVVVEIFALAPFSVQSRLDA